MPVQTIHIPRDTVLQHLTAINHIALERFFIEHLQQRVGLRIIVEHVRYAYLEHSQAYKVEYEYSFALDIETFEGTLPNSFRPPQQQQEEDVNNMPRLTQTQRQLIKPAPKETKIKSVEKADLFNKVQDNINNFSGSTNIYNNNVEKLLSPNFSYHPEIHRFYYDYKYDGILYVNCAKTNKRIRKDDSVLLPNGTFVTSSEVVYPTSSRINNIIEALLTKDDKNLERELGKKTYIKLGPMPVLLTKENIRLTLKAEHVSHLLKEAWDKFCNETGFILDDEGSLFDQEIYDTFKDYFKTVLPTLSTRRLFTLKVASEINVLDAFKIEEDNDFLPSCYLVHSGYRRFGQVFRESLTRQSSTSVPCICLNLREPELRIPDSGAIAGRNERQTRRLSSSDINFNFPIPLGLRVESQQETTRNRSTNNNSGSLMNYSAKVPEFKKSFLMCEDEGINYKANKESLNKRIKEHTAKVMKLKQEINKLQENDDDSSSFDTKLVELNNLVKQKPKLPPEQNPIFLGLELEAVTREGVDFGELIRNMAESGFGNHMLIKSDSSIGRNGFEIVTIPATLKYHKKIFEEHFFNEENKFDSKMMAKPTCGIHVHISRNVFTRLSLGKFISFINAPQNQTFINQMANRPPNSYCERLRLKGNNSKGVEMSAMDMAKKLKLEGRNLHLPRGAINLNTTEKTVEIRIFKASNNKNNIFRKLEFCEALVYYVRQENPRTLTVPRFIDFVMRKENQKLYPHLLMFFYAKNYCDRETRRIKGVGKIKHKYHTNKLKTQQA